MERWVARSVLGIAVLLAVAACGDAPWEAAEEQEADLFGRSPLFWTKTPGQTLSLRVCWKNPAAPILYPVEAHRPSDAATTTSTQESWVRAAIEQTWQRHLDVDFVGWGACVGGEEIAIAIGSPDTNSRVSGFGSALRTGEMTLNLSFGDIWRYFHLVTIPTQEANDIQFWVPQACESMEYDYAIAHPEIASIDTTTFRTLYERCVSAVAVHEFGHALGFLHEQYRRDVPWVAQEQACYILARDRWGDDVVDPVAWVQPGDTPLGPFDPQSIMSYCRTNWASFEPSAGDIREAQRIYGAR